MTKNIYLAVITYMISLSCTLAQTVELSKNNLEPVNVSMSLDNYWGKKAVRVIKNSDVGGADQPTYVKIKDIDFHNGTIELNVYSKLTKEAGEFARGFIGITFRINEDNSKFEGMYLRPTNARADDQLRRNHSLQYFSYPDYDCFKLRKETPGKYESYADMALNEWMKVKIVVNNSKAQLYLNNSEQPCLVVNDLKHGDNFSGSIGFWVDGGTEGYFSDLVITKNFK